MAERSISAKKLVPLRVTRIITPEPDSQHRYWGSYKYYLEVALPEDGDHWLNGNFMHEEGLTPFNREMKDLMLSAIFSRIEDLKELVVNK